MDAIAAVPPYAHVTQEAVQCAVQASSRYQVPELLLHAILVKENGRMGQCVRNKNGTSDCGFAQINTSWVPHFARYGVKLEHIINDTCTNLNASAYILRDNYNKKANWFDAVVAYNIGPNRWTNERYQVGYRYATDVVRNWWGFQNYVDAQQGIRRPQPVIPVLPKAAPSRSSGASARPSEKASSPKTAPQVRHADGAGGASWSRAPRPVVFESPG